MYLSTLQAERARINKTIKQMSDETGIQYETLKSRFKSGNFNGNELVKIQEYINKERAKLHKPLPAMTIEELFDYLKEVG